MSAEIKKLERDIAAVRNAVTKLRGKLDELDGAEIDQVLSSVSACVSELLPLRLSLDALKATRKHAN